MAVGRAALALLALLLAVLCAAGATAGGGSSGFRCMRPFSSLSRLAGSAMRGLDHCQFGPFRVQNASAAMRCAVDDGGEAGADPTCRVEVQVAFQMTQERDDRVAELDSYRYSLELRTGSTEAVSYKGFDGNGYSVCCSLLTDATCAWRNETDAADGSPRLVPVVVSCPLHDGGLPAFVGTVSKPLHRLAVAHWRAHLDFWRGTRDDKEQLGRLLLPFRLTGDDISLARSGERGAGGMDVAVRPADPKATNTADL